LPTTSASPSPSSSRPRTALLVYLYEPSLLLAIRQTANRRALPRAPHRRQRRHHRPTYNMAPGDFQPVIRRSRDTGECELVIMRWGIVPWFAKCEDEFNHFPQGAIRCCCPAKRSRALCRISANVHKFPFREVSPVSSHTLKPLHTCFRDERGGSGYGLSRTEFQHLFDEICGAVCPVQLLESSLQDLGSFTVPGILKHEDDCFAKPGRV
jgi:hypothetical protein